jgi:ankyrin repeat protein
MKMLKIDSLYFLFFLIYTSQINGMQIIQAAPPLTIAACKSMDIDTYTDSLIYYSQIDYDEAINFLVEHTSKKNKSETAAITNFIGYGGYKARDIKNAYGSGGGLDNLDCQWLRRIKEDCLSVIRLHLKLTNLNINTHYFEDTKESLLHFTVTSFKKDIVDFICTYKNCNVNIQDFESKTPLHYITLKKEEEIEKWDGKKRQKQIRALISHMKCLLTHPHIKVNLQDSKGNTPLHYAINFNLIDYLLAANNINLNIQNEKGETPLFYALQHRSCRVKEDGRRVIFIYNDHQVEQLIIDLRTDINLQNNNGDTPLHYVVQNPRVTLLPYEEHSEDFYIPPSRKYDNIRVEELLKRPDIRLDIQNNQGETPLMCAIKASNIEAVKLLLTHQNPDLTILDHKYLSPLDHALAIGNLDIIDVLRNNITPQKISPQNKNNLAASPSAHETIKKDPIQESFYNKYKKIIKIGSLMGMLGILSAGIVAYFHYLHPNTLLNRIIT